MSPEEYDAAFNDGVKRCAQMIETIGHNQQSKSGPLRPFAMRLADELWSRVYRENAKARTGNAGNARALGDESVGG